VTDYKTLSLTRCMSVPAINSDGESKGRPPTVQNKSNTIWFMQGQYINEEFY